jgi:D-alanine-D-alanine ligase
MARDRLKVVLLYNLSERLQKGEEKDILAEEAIIEEIGAVETSIQSLGHQCIVMAIHDEIVTTVHWLKEIRPDAVFNLCESVYGNTCWEMNIPALLDLFRIPYTGSPPLTLGLCQDKARTDQFPKERLFASPTERVMVLQTRIAVVLNGWGNLTCFQSK